MKKLYLPLALLCASYAPLHAEQASLPTLMHEIAHLTTENSMHPLMHTFFMLEKKNEVFGIEKEALKKLCAYALEILENNHSKIAHDSYLQHLVEELAFFEQKSQKPDIYFVQKSISPYSSTPSRISVITVDGDIYCKDAIILGNAHINQQLIVDNNITAQSNLAVTGNIDAAGNIQAHAQLAVDGDTTLAGHLSVAQAAQFNDAVSAQHGIAFSPQHQLFANGNILAADLVCDNAHINQQLIVDNNIAAQSNLAVAGNVDAIGNMHAHAQLAVDGDTALAGHLSVAQAAQFNAPVTLQQGMVLPHGALQQLESLTACSQQALSDGTYVRIHAFNLQNSVQQLSSGIFTFNVKSLAAQANALGSAFGMFLAQDAQTVSTSFVATKVSEQTQHIHSFVANSSFNQLSQEQQQEALNLLNGIIPGATLNSVLLFVLIHDVQPQEQLDCGRINLIQVS